MLAIGLTGSIASGKEAVASMLIEAGFVYFSLSDRVREEAGRCGFQPPSRRDLQHIGNELRGKFGPTVLAQRTLEKIDAAGVAEVVVDGFRNPHEVECFRQRTRFYLVAVDAPTTTRFERLLERRRPGDPETLPEFLELDARDRGLGESREGQQVGACLKLATFSVWNEGSLEDLRQKLDALLTRIPRTSRSC